ncbi:MAG: tyrosine-type recombinase/integrase [Dehalococcoidia bacterium]
MLKQMGNDELFQLYDKDLILRLRNAKNLSDTKKILVLFKDHLGDYPPSAELAKSFIYRYLDRKPRTLYRYAQMVRMFMKWYGEPITDFKVRVPKSLPPYTDNSDIDRLFQAIESKVTHKKLITRDRLLVELALKSGMRRGELASLEVRDIHGDFLVVRRGKYEKDRAIPLPPDLTARLGSYIKGKEPAEKVFNLKGPSITMKIKKFARKAGLADLHAHALRHKFATDLLEHGADIRSVQELLGHENLSTTQVYLAVTDKRLREAVNLLEGGRSPKKVELPEEPVDRPIVTVKAVYKSAETVSTVLPAPTYLSHFVVSNEGKTPAIELEVGLLDSHRNSLEGRRETVLMVGEKIEWTPTWDKPDGQYYVVCQYRTATANKQSEQWNQTWLPFELIQAGTPGDVFVVQGHLNFQANIEQNEKIIV